MKQRIISGKPGYHPEGPLPRKTVSFSSDKMIEIHNERDVFVTHIFRDGTGLSIAMTDEEAKALAAAILEALPRKGAETD